MENHPDHQPAATAVGATAGFAGTDAATTGQRFAAELLGTFVLVFFGCGAAIMSGLGQSGYVTTGLAFGFAVVVMTYAVGRVSGGHFNPVLSVGAAIAGRLPWRLVGLHVAAQLVGGLVAGLVLWGLLHGFEGFSGEGQMAQNSFGDQGTGFAWWAAFGLELLMAAVLVWVALAVTDERNERVAAVAPLAIGLTYALVHFASLPATGTGVNPARSIGVGVFAGVDAVLQLWLFVVAPLLGAVLGGVLHPLVLGRGSAPVPGSGLSFGGRRPPPQQYGVPPGYAQPWQPAPGQPGEWGQPAPHWGQPQGSPQWGQPSAPHGDPLHGHPPAAPHGSQHWGQPAPDDDEDGRTQIRRPD